MISIIKHILIFFFFSTILYGSEVHTAPQKKAHSDTSSLEYLKEGKMVPEILDESVYKQLEENSISYGARLTNQVSRVNKGLDVTFLLGASVLVFFMQAGFCLVELGSVRTKNTLNVMMKNSLDFSISFIMFFLFGFVFMFGNSIGGFIGWEFNFLDGKTYGGWDRIWIFFIYQAVIVATATTITSGAIAERTRFLGYLATTVVISGFIYPIVGHWVWGDLAGVFHTSFGGDQGWIEKIGFVDFAGSSVVHCVGGACALAALVVIGPRRGRFSSDGTPVDMVGHNMVLVSLGTFILIVGFVGLNCGANLYPNYLLGVIAVNTLLGAAAAGLSSLLTYWLRDGVPEPVSVLNGTLGGLVAVTAGCHAYPPMSVLIIGAVAGIITTHGNELLLRFKIDDVIGAVPIHLFNGIWGCIAVALFRADGFSFEMLLVQFIGVFIISWASFLMALIAFTFIKKTVGLRVSKDEEEMGLDYVEHCSVSYPEFKQ